MTTSSARPLYGLVLAGGMSTRMGTDKAALVLEGKTQLDRTMEKLEGLVDKSFVSVRSIKNADKVRSKYNMIEDTDLGKGPVAALVAAHQAHPDAAWLVLAVDIPLIKKTDLQDLLKVRSENQASHPKVVAWTWRSPFNGRPEPLAAVWEPAALDHLVKRAKEDCKCPGRILEEQETYLLEPTGHMLDNMNTPADLAQAKEALES